MGRDQNGTGSEWDGDLNGTGIRMGRGSKWDGDQNGMGI